MSQSSQKRKRSKSQAEKEAWSQKRKFKKARYVAASGYQVRPSPEIKAVDLINSGGIYDDNGSFYLLNGMVPGTGINQHVGNKVANKSVQLIGRTVYQGFALAGGATDFLRTIVFYDKQPNGAFPSVADLLQSVPATGAVSNTATDFLNMNNRDRFLILADIKSLMGAVGSAATSMGGPFTNMTSEALNNCHAEEVNITRYIKLHGLETVYKSANGDITDISTGAIVLFTMGLQPSGDEQYALDLSARLRYYDA